MQRTCIDISYCRALYRKAWLAGLGGKLAGLGGNNRVKVLWTERERHIMERYYMTQLRKHPAPRWVRRSMAERLALMNLQQLALNIAAKPAILEVTA